MMVEVRELMVIEVLKLGETISGRRGNPNLSYLRTFICCPSTTGKIGLLSLHKMWAPEAHSRCLHFSGHEPKSSMAQLKKTKRGKYDF